MNEIEKLILLLLLFFSSHPKENIIFVLMIDAFSLKIGAGTHRMPMRDRKAHTTWRNNFQLWYRIVPVRYGRNSTICVFSYHDTTKLYGSKKNE